MAYDEKLADRVRDMLVTEDGVSERKMFGGLAFMVRGHMACGLVGERFARAPHGLVNVPAAPGTGCASLLRVSGQTGRDGALAATVDTLSPHEDEY